MDVARLARAHDGAKKDDDDETVDRDLLGPCQAVVQHVAREELQEHAGRHAPEYRQGDPVLDGVSRQIDRRDGFFLKDMLDFLRGDLGVNLFTHRQVSGSRERSPARTAPGLRIC
jgi:hypothetical protein